MDQESPDPIPVQATRIAELQLPGWTVQQHLQQADIELKALRRWMFDRHQRRGRSEYMREIDWMIRQSWAALIEELQRHGPDRVRWMVI